MDPKTHPLNGITNATGIAPPRGYALSGKVMLAAIVVLFSVVLLILFLHLYVRYHVYRRQQRRQRRRQRLIFSSSVDHAPSKGLDSAILNSLSVLIFSPDDGVTDDEDATECAVCLSEFVDGEKVRVLPRCDHHFHVDCIDMWFCSHSNCPLCRSPVEIEAVTSPVKNSTPCGDPAIEIGSGSSSGSDRDPDPIRVDNSSVEVQLGLWSWILAVRKFFLRESRPIPDLERGEAAAPAVE